MHDNEPLLTTLFGPESRLAAYISGYESRPVQIRMARLVMEAMLAEHHLIVEAATGTGKTLAYLLPLLSLGRRIVISTATKALQDQLLGKDIPLLRKAIARPFTAMALKGRDNYLCLFRFRAFQAAGMPVSDRERRWAQQVAGWVQETRVGDRSELSDLPQRLFFWSDISTAGDHCQGRRCPDYDACFLTKARDQAKKVDLVVVNHSLYFADLAVKEGGFGEILPEHDQVVFDEAHRVPDVVTHNFGWRLSNRMLMELARDCRGEAELAGADDPMLLQCLPTLEQSAVRLRQAFPPENFRDGLMPATFQGEPGRALVAVEGALHDLLKYLEPHRVRSPGLAACCRRTEALLTVSGQIRVLEDPQRVYWFETRGQGVFLVASPLETGPTLQTQLFPRVKTAIFTSATLATGSGDGGFSYLQHQLGLGGNPDVVCERLPPAFDYANRTLLYLPQVFPEPARVDFPGAVTAEIAVLLAMVSGRTLCLFTSFRVLDAVKKGLSGKIPYRLLVQGDHPPGQLLEIFKQDTASVLLGTFSFWEGVDVPGEALSMVIIDKLPFASPADPLVAARSRWVEANKGNAFMEVSLPEAILKLKQGLGRLLRQSSDRGALAVLDVRLTRKRYGQQFLAGLPPAPVTHDREAVRRFFL